MEWIVTRDGGPKVNKGKHEGEYLLYQKYYKSKERKASRINSDKWCEPFKTEIEALIKAEFLSFSLELHKSALYLYFQSDESL